MIGIDIVDLTDPKLRIRDLENLKFILHPNDRFDSTLSRIFWNLWTAKEAVFKAHRQRTIFKPKEINIRFSPDREGLFQSGDFHGQVTLSENIIMAVAYLPKLKNHVISGKVDLPGPFPSQTLRKHLVSSVYPFRHHSIRSDEQNLPTLCQGCHTIPLSLSHHHKLGAYATYHNLKS